MLDTDDLYTADEVRAELTATARDAFLKGQASERRRVTDLFRFAVLANGSGAKMLKALEALDGTVTKAEWDESKHPRDGGKFASKEGAQDEEEEPEEEEEEEPRDPEEDDIPSHSRIDGQRWGSRERIAEYTTEGGDERTVRIEEGTFEFDGRDHTCYRWTTHSDEDGEWTLDRDRAVSEGQEYASDNHHEPEEEEEEAPDLDRFDTPQKRDVTVGASKLPVSRADVQIHRDADEPLADAIVGKLFGGDGSDYDPLMHVVGMPDDAKVTVTEAGALEPLFSDDAPLDGCVGVRVKVEHPDMDRVNRFVGYDAEGTPFIRNEILELKKGAQGTGAGETIFAKQVEAASSAGFGYIQTHAAGGFGQAMNGYYTWPSFGYDQALDDPASDGPAFDKARALFPDAKSVLDIMAVPRVDLPPDEFAETKAKLEALDAKLKKAPKARDTITGADWWKVNGTDLHNARFDLDPGSRSMAVLGARRKKSAPAVTKSTSRPSKSKSATTFGTRFGPTGFRFRKSAPPADTWADGDEAALLLAAIDETQHAIAEGDDPQPVLDALYSRRGTVQKAGKYDEDKHPRDDKGRFISKTAIAAAKGDPAKAQELKDKVTDPVQRKKLDAALADKSGAFIPAKDQAKQRTAEKREAVRANRRTAMELVNRIRDQHARGDGVSADDLHALIPHLSTMSHDELSNVRTQLFRLGAQFGGTRKLQERANKLAEWARKAALDARMEEQGFSADEKESAKEAVGLKEEVPANSPPITADSPPIPANSRPAAPEAAPGQPAAPPLERRADGKALQPDPQSPAVRAVPESDMADLVRALDASPYRPGSDLSHFAAARKHLGWDESRFAHAVQAARVAGHIRASSDEGYDGRTDDERAAMLMDAGDPIGREHIAMATATASGRELASRLAPAPAGTSAEPTDSTPAAPKPKRRPRTGADDAKPTADEFAAASQPAQPKPAKASAPPAVAKLKTDPLADKKHLTALAAAAPPEARDHLETAAWNAPGDKSALAPEARRRRTVERLAAAYRDAHRAGAGHEHIAGVLGTFGAKLDGPAEGATVPFDGSRHADAGGDQGPAGAFTGTPVRVVRRPVIGPDGSVAVKGEVEPLGAQQSGANPKRG